MILVMLHPSQGDNTYRSCSTPWVMPPPEIVMANPPVVAPQLSCMSLSTGLGTSVMLITSYDPAAAVILVCPIPLPTNCCPLAPGQKYSVLDTRYVPRPRATLIPVDKAALMAAVSSVTPSPTAPKERTSRNPPQAPVMDPLTARSPATPTPSMLSSVMLACAGGTNFPVDTDTLRTYWPAPLPPEAPTSRTWFFVVAACMRPRACGSGTAAARHVMLRAASTTEYAQVPAPSNDHVMVYHTSAFRVPGYLSRKPYPSAKLYSSPKCFCQMSYPRRYPTRGAYARVPLFPMPVETSKKVWMAKLSAMPRYL